MTPEYASPEQVRGDPLTTSSDIYTLGVLLYELLTGCPPYEVTTASPMEAMRLVCEQDPERPSTRAVRAGRPAWGSSGSATTANERAATRGTHPERLRRRLQGELDAIVLTAMRKEPGLRYGSADLLAQDIVRHLDGLPVTAHAGSTVHRVRRFVRRHRVETVAAALVALSLVAGAGVAAWQAALADSARDRAEGARANAEEVALFLSGLFGAADPLAPTAERIDTLRAGQLLDRGAARVRQELADQPLVRAQLLDVVGRVYHNLGRYEDARAALEEALSIRQGHLGERHQEVAETLTHLGVVLVATDDFDGAGDRLKRALAIDRQVWGAEHPRVAEDLHHLATAYRESGRFPEAIQHHLEALRIMRETAGDSDPRLPTFLRELVATLERQGNYVEAERYSRESVMLHRRLFGDGHAMLATPLRDLGFLLQRNGEFAAAEGLFREAYAIAIGTVGERHPQTADLLNRLASVRAWQNDFHAADSIHREAIDLKRQLYGDTHLEVAYSLSNLAWVKRQQHDYTQADSLHRAALEVVRTVVGREHSAYWIMLGGRGRTLQAAGECEAAEPLLRESSEGLRRTMPAEPYRVALNQISLGACAIARDRFSDAEKILLESHAALKPRGAQDSFVLEVSEQLVSLYTSWGRPKDALRYDVNSRIPLPP
jgi:serine/threonine-protein kinase